MKVILRSLHCKILKKSLPGLVLAWKSNLKMPILAFGPSCPLQTILLSDLVGCDSPLQIVTAVWRPFFKIWTVPKSRCCQQRAVTPDPGSSNSFKKMHKTPITIYKGLSHPTGWAALPSENISRWFFSSMEKPSEDINSRLFLMNKKGLKKLNLHYQKLLCCFSSKFFTFLVGVRAGVRAAGGCARLQPLCRRMRQKVLLLSFWR